jgi:hypothetical protein
VPINLTGRGHLYCDFNHRHLVVANTCHTNYSVGQEVNSTGPSPTGTRNASSNCVSRRQAQPELNRSQALITFKPKEDAM